MSPDRSLVYARFQPWAWLLVALVFIQVVVGSTVRATGSGMGCPDWPLCHGGFLPAGNFQSMLEYSHRAVAALVSTVAITLGSWIGFSDALRAQLGRLAAGMGLLLVVLISFGAVTVAYDMPPAVVACHLELAALFLVTWLTVALRAREMAKGLPMATPQAGFYRFLAPVALGAALVQLFLGALVSVSHAGLACPDFPNCYDGLMLPPLVGNVGIQMIHRFGAYTLASLVFGLVVAAELGAAATVRRWTRLAALLVVVQIALGASAVLLGIPPLLSVAHMANGMALFVTLYRTVYACYPRLGAALETSPRKIEAPQLTNEQGLVQDPSGAGLDLRTQLNAYYQMTKPSIVLLVVLTGLPAILIASKGRVDLALAIAALVGTSLAAASAAVFNQYFERERDKVMERTAKRPIPSGLVRPNAALAFAITLGVLSMVVLLGMTTWLAAGIALGSLFFYGFFYTLVLKDASPQNIVVGGIAGATAPLIGWAAVTGQVGLPAWIMFTIIFLWTPPHFWALAIFRLDDYAKAGIPMFPVVYGVPATARWIVIYSLMLVPLTLLLVPLGAAGPIYFISAIVLGLGFLYLAGAVLMRQRRQDAVKLFAYSIMYTLALFTSLTVDAALGGPGMFSNQAVIVQAAR